MTSAVEYDCTRKCRYRAHGNTITASLTKRSIADDKLAAFLAKICRNCDVVDDLGRSAVHLAASVGRYAVLEWLLHQGAHINLRDFESGSSPLHRAIFYGCLDCAVLLLRNGASLDILDEDTRSPLQSVCRMGDFHQYADAPSSNDLLVWGSNKNYNLGLGDGADSDQPTSIEFFRKQHVSIKLVALGSYHSLFLDKKSQLYAVGHGKGGRLGVNVESTLAAPKKVKVPIKNADEMIIDMSVSRKHSLLLTNRSVVFACGLNDDQQLGVRAAGEKLTTFKEVVTLRDLGVSGLQRVIALDDYSVAYSEEALYAWGLNIGQFGMKLNDAKNVPVPKQIPLPPNTAIKFVEANNSAIVVVTKEKSIILLYNGKTKTLKPPKFESIKGICVVGGDTGKAAKGTVTALKLLILTSTNVIYLWYEMKQCFVRCIFSHIRIAEIDKIFYKGNQVLILSQGDVYRGKFNQVPVPAYIVESEAAAAAKHSFGIWNNCDQNRTEVSKDYMIRIDLQRIAIIDRAVDIFCNSDFTSFAVLQESTHKYFKLPTLTAEEYVFKKLYNDVSTDDVIHDVVFHVDDETFAAHRLMVYARAPGLSDLIINQCSNHVYLSFELLTSKMFELMLKHIYTNYLPNDDDLDDINRSLGPKSCDDNAAVCQLFLTYVEKFQIVNLAKFLRSQLEQELFYLPVRVDKSKYRFNRLRPTDFPKLHDVRIICDDGNGGEVELPAHKCILVARLEYFEMMFTHTWSEKAVINLKSIPIDYMRPILDFLYTADVEQFRKQNYTQTYLYNMIVFCDQFFIERLRKVCEISILEKISIRKCAEMLDFAVMYNCEILKRGCMEFICQNLARVLSCRCLEDCDSDALSCLNRHYRNMFKDIFDYRMITPDSEAIEDELLLSFVDDFPIDLSSQLYYKDDSNQKNIMKQQRSHDATRSTQAKHKYERDAISSMMSNEFTEQRKPHSSLSESQVSTENQQTETKSWTKVDKKDTKKRLISLESEDKVPVMVSLPLGNASVRNENITKATTTPEKDVQTQVQVEVDKTPSKSYNISLAEFTPTKEKLSQKQRKRLVSETSSHGAAANQHVTSPTPATTPKAIVQPSVWNVLPPISQTDAGLLATSPTTGSSADPTSFANMTRTAGASNPSSPDNSSFSKILADERKQREYFERMRNKSLVLTQIEELAIAELHDFYNVDNVTDEIITIERKPRAVTQNFAVWQRN